MLLKSLTRQLGAEAEIVSHVQLSPSKDSTLVSPRSNPGTRTSGFTKVGSKRLFFLYRRSNLLSVRSERIRLEHKEI